MISKDLIRSRDSNNSPWYLSPVDEESPEFRLFLKEYITDRVPESSWRNARRNRVLPFRWSNTAEAVTLALLPYCTGELKSEAVYVLECLHTSNDVEAMYLGGRSGRYSRKKLFGGIRQTLEEKGSDESKFVELRYYCPNI